MQVEEKSPIMPPLRHCLVKKLDTNALEELEKSFQHVDKDNRKYIEIEEFEVAMNALFAKNGITHDDIMYFFYQLDPKSLGKVTWVDFMEFLHQYNELENNRLKYAYRAFCEEPSVHRCLNHKDAIICFRAVRNSRGEVDYIGGNYISASRNGLILFWNSDMELVTKSEIEDESKKMRGQNTVGITDMVHLPNLRLIAIATTIWEVRLYESIPSAFHQYISIVEFPKTVRCLDYSVRSEGMAASLLLCGDDDGNVHALWMDPAFFLNLRMSLTLKQQLSEILFTHLKRKLIRGISLTTYERLHSESVTQVKYLPPIRSIISCSASTKEAICLNNISVNNKIYYKSDKGVNCCYYSKELDCVVGGGVDSNIRIWYRQLNARAARLLIGHASSVLHILVDEPRQLVISLSADSMLKCWELSSGTCLQTIGCNIPGLGGHTVTSMFYNPVRRVLFLHTYRCAEYRAPKDDAPELMNTHREPICAALYNSLFDSVVTGSEASDIHVWDFRTGRQLFHFEKAHMRHTVGAVALTAMTFDGTQRRLVTGARDGSVKVWNFNAGICLNSFQTENRQGVTCIRFVGNMFYVTGSSRKVTAIYDDGLSNFKYIWDEVHATDIMSLGVYRRGCLATASFDGEIILWIKENSVVRCKMRDEGHKYNDYSREQQKDFEKGSEADESSSQDAHFRYTPLEQGMSKILILQSRLMRKDVAALVSCGKDGLIRMWSIFPGSSILGRFRGSDNPLAGVLCLATDRENKYLISSDTTGYVKVWHLEGYCNGEESVPPERMEEFTERFPYLRLQRLLVEKGKKSPQFVQQKPDPWLVQTEQPLLLNSFRAHVKCITSLEFIDSHEVIMTGCVGGSVRLWHISGRHIGEFRPKESWDVASPESLYPRQLRNMPEEIRRNASPTTLKVMNMGACPRWEIGLKAIRKCKRMGVLRPHDDRKADSKLEEVAPILGTCLEIKQAAVPLTEIDELYDINFRVSAFSQMKIGDLTPITPITVEEHLAKYLTRSGRINKKKLSDKAKKEVRPVRQWIQ